jgi:hypothetical protein
MGGFTSREWSPEVTRMHPLSNTDASILTVG